MPLKEKMPCNPEWSALQPAAIRPSENLTFYDRLMSLTLRHDFYGDALCADFEIAPTAATRVLMSQLGLMARPRRGGIDIIYQTGRAEGLVRYLYDERKRRKDAKDTSPEDRQTSFKGSWTRLTFTLVLRNELFANFSAIPLPMANEMKLGDYALYLSNRFVKKREPRAAPAQLNSEWEPHWRKLPASVFAPEHLHFGTPNDAAQFNLYSTSGRALLCAVLKNVYRAEKLPAFPARVCLDPGRDIHVSMANETPGLFSYEIKKRDAAFETAEGSQAVDSAENPLPEFFYSGMRSAPLLLADLFLADPETKPDAATVGGDYPISLPKELPDESTAVGAAGTSSGKDIAVEKGQARAEYYLKTYIAPREYEFRFAARKTIWIYYIVLSSRAAVSESLAIEADATRSVGSNEPEPGALPADSIEFNEPEAVTLPTGAPAWRFVARKALPLRHRSTVWLRLLARGADNGSRHVLLEPLPTPSAERITAWPKGPLCDATAASEVFVYL